MVNTFLKYLSISGAIFTINVDDFLSSKRIMKYIEKIDLSYLIGDFYWRFLGGASILEIKASFPLKPSVSSCPYDES